MFGKEQIQSLAESLDRFSKGVERIASALEKLEVSHREYVNLSKAAMERTLALQEASQRELERMEEEES